MKEPFSKQHRSAIMKSIKSTRNKSTELKLLSIFKKRNINGWRRNVKLFGKPDFVFLNTKKVVFVDGCFWHGHKCRNTKPVNNRQYWTNKIKRNIARDKQVNNVLTNSGWKIVRIWECELKTSNFVKLNRKLHLLLLN